MPKPDQNEHQTPALTRRLPSLLLTSLSLLAGISPLRGEEWKIILNGGEETITRTPNYAQKKVVTSSSKGWSRTDTFNPLGLTASSNLNGTGTPNATLTPTWRADGTLADVAFTLGGETHTATFKNNGTLASLTAPGRGNILGGHAIGGDTETLAVDNNTTARRLDGTQVSVSGANVIGKTETLSTSGGGFQLTTHPATGADTAVAFNAAGAPTGKAYAAGAGEAYAHFPGGLLKQVTLARGGTLEFGYSNDGAKDLVSATWPAVTSGAFACAPISQGYGYDAAGRINSVADASGSRALSYANGRSVQTAWTGGALAGYRIVDRVGPHILANIEHWLARPVRHRVCKSAGILSEWGTDHHERTIHSGTSAPACAGSRRASPRAAPGGEI